MAKFCTNCGNELPENAGFCVNCGKMVEGNNTNNNINNKKKQEKKKGLPTWAIILIVVGCVVIIPFIAFCVLAAAGFKYLKNNDIKIENYIDDYVDDVITSKGTVGDTLKGDDFRITLKSATKYDTIGEGSLAKTPAEGKEYLVFLLEVENISDDEEYISDMDFNGYVDNNLVSNLITFSDVDGQKALSGTLASGKKTDGYIAYEIDKNWKEFELHYKEGYNGNKMIFSVVNENNDTQNQDA